MTTPSLHRAVLTLALLVGCHRSSGAPEVTPAQGAAPVRVATAAAAAREVPDVLLATGSLVPDQMAQVTPIVGGRVMQTFVERGSRVREGDPLIRLRDTDYRTNAAAAQATLAQVRARLGLDGAAPFRAINGRVLTLPSGQERRRADDSARRFHTVPAPSMKPDTNHDNFPPTPLSYEDPPLARWRAICHSWGPCIIAAWGKRDWTFRSLPSAPARCRPS